MNAYKNLCKVIRYGENLEKLMKKKNLWKGNLRKTVETRGKSTKNSWNIKIYIKWLVMEIKKKKYGM